MGKTRAKDRLAQISSGEAVRTDILEILDAVQSSKIFSKIMSVMRQLGPRQYTGSLNSSQTHLASKAVVQIRMHHGEYFQTCRAKNDQGT